MSLKNTFVRALMVIAMGSAALFVLPVGAHTTDAGPYTTIDPAQPSDTAGKIEVLEFFSYSCPHCNAIEPLVEKWVKTLPENVVFRAVPVAFNASAVDLQKLYYSLESMERLDLHSEVFKAIHEQSKRIYDAKSITDWVVSKGVDRKQFEDVFNSFGVKTKAMRADELMKNYKVDGTPTIAVGGKYLTSPSQTKGYEATIEEAQRLVEKVEKE